MPGDGVGSLVGSYASYLLRHELVALTEELVSLIGAAVPDYADLSAVSEAELRLSCQLNLGVALAELAGTAPLVDPLATPQHETGQRRARQRLPLESLLHSYRLGGRVLWQGLVRRAAQGGSPREHRQLLDEAWILWEVIDRHSFIVARAYREEQGRLQQRTQRRRSALLIALLEGHGVDAELAQDAASVLDMPLRGPRFVVVAAMDQAQTDPAPSADRVLDAAGFSAAWAVQARQESGLVCLTPEQSLDDAVAVLTGAAVGAVAVSGVVDRFDEVAAAYRLAELTLQTLPAGYVGVALVTEHLPQALLAAASDVTTVLVQQTLGAVLELGEAEQRTYLDTLQVLLDCDGSYVAAARELFCHRNTVLQRAKRLQSLTGYSLSSPTDRLHLHLALLAVRSGHHTPPPVGTRPGH
jgi:hypothetical protein